MRIKKASHVYENFFLAHLGKFIIIYVIWRVSTLFSDDGFFYTLLSFVSHFIIYPPPLYSVLQKGRRKGFIHICCLIITPHSPHSLIIASCLRMYSKQMCACFCVRLVSDLIAFSRSSLQLFSFFFLLKFTFFSFPFRRHGLEIPAANDHREGR